MRGKDETGEVKPVGYRITPAYAGKSIAFGIKYHFSQDHPRLCGEKQGKMGNL